MIIVYKDCVLSGSCTLVKGVGTRVLVPIWLVHTDTEALVREKGVIIYYIHEYRSIPHAEKAVSTQHTKRYHQGEKVLDKSTYQKH